MSRQIWKEISREQFDQLGGMATHRNPNGIRVYSREGMKSVFLSEQDCKRIERTIAQARKESWRRCGSFLNRHKWGYYGSTPVGVRASSRFFVGAKYRTCKKCEITENLEQTASYTQNLSSEGKKP